MIIKNKNSQVTLFIIIAIVIVAVIVIIAYPSIRKTFAGTTISQSIQDCFKGDFDSAFESAMAHGGSINPENSILYNGEKREYLCYTAEYYKTCLIQQPLLREHFENEISGAIRGKAQDCVNSVISEYEKKGYTVTKKGGDISVSAAPGIVKLSINSQISITKGSTESYNGISITRKSNAYTLIMIASSILNSEARYGDSVPESYMLMYPNLKVEKLKQSDGSKIYILSDRETGEKFIFASRSLSWPAGYKF